MHLKAYGRIKNREYRHLTGAINRTASRDLEDLVSKGVLRKIGQTGRNVHYSRKGPRYRQISQKTEVKIQFRSVGMLKAYFDGYGR